MKTSGNSEEPNKSTQSKATKKSTKSRSKTAKLEAGSKSNTAAGSALLVGGVGVGSLPATPTHVNIVTTPTTPTTSLGQYNMFDASFMGAGGGHGCSTATEANNRLGHHKSYAGFDPRSIKIFWEQHDQTDVELSQDVCSRLAEDATYKVWELINNVKIYSRHSAGIVTYDLVNEVLKDADVPPMLGAMDSDWDRIDYDGSFFFHSDKIFELREEFQKDITLTLPHDVDFQSHCPIEDKNLEQMQQCVQSLVTAAIFGNAQERAKALTYAFETPLMGSCYRVLVSKMLQLLAFRQQDVVNQRCWRLLRACNYNPQANHTACRQEYFHLSEVLISQLMAPYETIKVPSPEVKEQQQQLESSVKMELEEELKVEQLQETEAEQDLLFPSEEQTIYKLQLEDDTNEALTEEAQHMSGYFATPVANSQVDDLCETIGQLAAQSGYLQGECLFLIQRRLARFFEGRQVDSERDFKYLSRAVRGLIALGEYSFREFIPYIYHLNVEDIPESLWQDLASAATFLNGRDDIYLYEWLEHGCGADKLQPFLINFAASYQKMLTQRFVQARTPSYCIEAQPGVRRLEWSTLAAAMCHGDDPSKALKPKPTLSEAFPELVHPNLQLNCKGNIKFKFAGCRPVLLKPKTVADTRCQGSNGGGGKGNSDILIARRKLFKPLTNVRKVVALTSYHYLKI